MQHTHFALAALALLAPLGCGDDDGGDTGADEDAAAAFGANVPEEGPLWTADVVVEFSAPAEAASIDEGSVIVRGPDGPLAATRTLSDDGLALHLSLDEVPALPATISFELTDAVTSVSGQSLPAVSWERDAPLWYAAPMADLGSPRSPSVAVLDDGRVATAGMGERGVFAKVSGGDDTYAQVFEGPSGRALVRAGGDSVAVGYTMAGQIQIVDPTADEPAAEAVPGSEGADAFGLAIDEDGAVVVAWHDAEGVAAARRAGDEWLPLGEVLAIEAEWIDLAHTSAGLLLAHESAAGIAVLHWDGSAWVDFGAALDDGGSTPVFAGDTGAAPHIAWLRDGSAQVASWDGTAWQRLGALELSSESDVLAPPSLATDAEGDLWASWVESSERGDRALVARRAGDRWRVYGGAVVPDDAGATALAIDTDGNPIAAVTGDDAFTVARWNRSPALPHGQVGGEMGACTIASPPAPLLSDTGCYADLAARELVAGAIPYSVRAPLWSDGAFKRRFVILPEGGTIGYAATGPWTFPVGAIFVKEFWLEKVEGDPRTRFPVETRFWVKRCEEGECIEPWQGYSYQWNAEGTDAELLDGIDAERVDWTVTRGGEEVVHTHIHPSRFECIRCHARPAGRVLGMRAGQLAGAHDYGNAVDFQLRTLAHAGVFGDSLTETDAAEVAAWPAPGDPGAPLDGRVRAYLHANCAHCHKQDLTGDESPGEAPVMDLRFSTPLADTDLCAQVVPSNAEASRLYEVDATRGPGQMPPLATDLLDSSQLPVTAAWIGAMATCP